MNGYTLIELIITTLALSILALVGLPVLKDVLDSHRITATVEEMKAIAAVSDIARQLPGGDSFNDVTTDVISTLLKSYNASNINIPETAMTTDWGEKYLVTTSGKYAVVSVIIPFKDVAPFEAVTTSSGSQTRLIVSHQPQSRNSPVATASKFNKHQLYLE